MVTRPSDELKTFKFFQDAYKLVQENQDASILIQWSSEVRKKYRRKTSSTTPQGVQE